MKLRNLSLLVYQVMDAGGTVARFAFVYDKSPWSAGLQIAWASRVLEVPRMAVTVDTETTLSRVRAPTSVQHRVTVKVPSVVLEVGVGVLRPLLAYQTAWTEAMGVWVHEQARHSNRGRRRGSGSEQAGAGVPVAANDAISSRGSGGAVDEPSGARPRAASAVPMPAGTSTLTAMSSAMPGPPARLVAPQAHGGSAAEPTLSSPATGSASHATHVHVAVSVDAVKMVLLGPGSGSEAGVVSPAVPPSLAPDGTSYSSTSSTSMYGRSPDTATPRSMSMPAVRAGWADAAPMRHNSLATLGLVSTDCRVLAVVAMHDVSANVALSPAGGVTGDCSLSDLVVAECGTCAPTTPPGAGYFADAADVELLPVVSVGLRWRAAEPRHGHASAVSSHHTSRAASPAVVSELDGLGLDAHDRRGSGGARDGNQDDRRSSVGHGVPSVRATVALDKDQRGSVRARVSGVTAVLRLPFLHAVTAVAAQVTEVVQEEARRSRYRDGHYRSSLATGGRLSSAAAGGGVGAAAAEGTGALDGSNSGGGGAGGEDGLGNDGGNGGGVVAGGGGVGVDTNDGVIERRASGVLHGVGVGAANGMLPFAAAGGVSGLETPSTTAVEPPRVPSTLLWNQLRGSLGDSVLHPGAGPWFTPLPADAPYLDNVFAHVSATDVSMDDTDSAATCVLELTVVVDGVDLSVEDGVHRLMHVGVGPVRVAQLSCRVEQADSDATGGVEAASAAAVDGAGPDGLRPQPVATRAFTDVYACVVVPSVVVTLQRGAHVAVSRVELGTDGSHPVISVVDSVTDASMESFWAGRERGIAKAAVRYLAVAMVVRDGVVFSGGWMQSSECIWCVVLTLGCWLAGQKLDGSKEPTALLAAVNRASLKAEQDPSTVALWSCVACAAVVLACGWVCLCACVVVSDTFRTYWACRRSGVAGSRSVGAFLPVV